MKVVSSNNLKISKNLHEKFKIYRANNNNNHGGTSYGSRKGPSNKVDPRQSLDRSNVNKNIVSLNQLPKNNLKMPDFQITSTNWQSAGKLPQIQQETFNGSF